jgi:acetylornithine deacetylase/succinyl-diaminopimelate desuccinylase-like protein
MPDALNPRIEHGRLYGRGSADPKGSLAAMIHMFQIAASDSNFPVDLCLAGCMDEEISMTGSRALAERSIEVDAAVVGEPTQLRIVTSQKGAVRWRVRTRGVSAHSATPELGHNAIVDMARILPVIADAIEPRLNERIHPVLGTATWNVGTVHGGTAVNVVPDLCEIEIDRRLIPGDTAEQVVSHVNTALEKLQETDPDLRIEYDPPFVDIPAIETPEESPIVQAAKQAVAAVGRPYTPEGVAYATDAAMLTGIGGIPAVVLGPGNIARAHTNNEWIEIEELEAAVGIYRKICSSYANILS